jgi:hypothetical protein
MRTLLWVLSIGGALGAAYGLYHLEHEVKTMERALTRVEQATRRDSEAVQVLQAEWSYLNRPERLQELTQRHLTLSPLLLKQIVATPTALAALPDAPPRTEADEGDGRAVEVKAPVPIPVPKPAPPRRMVVPAAPVVAASPPVAVAAAFRVEDIVVKGTR